jgi:pSer/pThr/pTyr-binding forkhead associated (FHA) protein
MTTYSPVGPFTLAIDEDTHVLAPEAAEETLDALPLLDANLVSRTIAPELALRGHYLALGDGTESRLLRLDRDVIHLGRGSAAEVRFDEYRVSRDHAILVRHGSRIRLLDNRSANGTFVNGRRIVATNLMPGDVIDLGPVRTQLIEVR